MVAWRPWTPSAAPVQCSQALLVVWWATRPPLTRQREDSLSLALIWEVENRGEVVES